MAVSHPEQVLYQEASVGDARNVRRSFFKSCFDIYITQYLITKILINKNGKHAKYVVTGCTVLGYYILF